MKMIRIEGDDGLSDADNGSRFGDQWVNVDHIVSVQDVRVATLITGGKPVEFSYFTKIRLVNGNTIQAKTQDAVDILTLCGLKTDPDFKEAS